MQSVDVGNGINTLASPPLGSEPWVSAETFTAAHKPLGAARLSALLKVVDIFSPNEEEAASMLGIRSPERV
jgi:sugar/nucleoside kinase (ribokinase family)